MGQSCHPTQVLLHALRPLYFHTNLIIKDMQSKPSTACFKTFIQQPNHLLESLSSSKAISNKRCPSLSMELEKIAYWLQFNALYYGTPSKSYISNKICEFKSTPTPAHSHNGSLTSDMGDRYLRRIRRPPLPSLTSCVAALKVISSQVSTAR